MTFETYANRLMKRLEHLGYVSHGGDGSVAFYLPNYTSNNGCHKDLFNIYYDVNVVRYMEDINDIFWSIVDIYDYKSLIYLYFLSKDYVIKAKKLQIQKKLKDIENDF